jgi:hypothetical protein
MSPCPEESLKFTPIDNMVDLDFPDQISIPASAETSKPTTFLIGILYFTYPRKGDKMDLVPNLANKEYLIFSLVEGNQILFWELDMEKANGTPIYWLGNSLGHLMAFMATGQPIQVAINGANSALLNLGVFLNIGGLPLSRIAAQQIVNNINQFPSSHKLVGNIPNAIPNKIFLNSLFSIGVLRIGY